VHRRPTRPAVPKTASRLARASTLGAVAFLATDTRLGAVPQSPDAGQPEICSQVSAVSNTNGYFFSRKVANSTTWARIAAVARVGLRARIAS
jgi:hypothetical protein